MLTRRNFIKSLGALAVLPIASQIVALLPIPPAAPTPHSFSPADIPGLTYWFDASRDNSPELRRFCDTVVVYDRPLTDAENQQVSDYINSRWRV